MPIPEILKMSLAALKSAYSYRVPVYRFSVPSVSFEQMEVSLIIQMMSGGIIRTVISLMTLKRTGISTLRMEITGE